MNALKPKPPFQVLIMSEESRLGREAIETAYALKQIITAGVRVLFYLEDRERTFDTPTDKLMLSVTAFADEMEREKARQRTYDAMVRKARAGLRHRRPGLRLRQRRGDRPMPCTGTPSAPCRAPDQRGRGAAVMREIFAWPPGGWGTRRIAKTLNAGGVPGSPAPTRRPAERLGSLLYPRHADRALYGGEVVWNRSREAESVGHQAADGAGRSQWVQLRGARPADRPGAAVAGGARAIRVTRGRRTSARTTGSSGAGRPTASSRGTS